MKFWAVRVGNALVPDGDGSLAEFEKLPFGKPLQTEVTQPRNSAHSRLYWKLCQRIGSGIGKPAEWVSDAFKVETGHYDQFDYGGRQHIVLRSIAFHKFDQIQFREFFESCIKIMYENWKIDTASVADLLVPQEGHKR